MSVVKFKQGDYDVENLTKVIQQGGQKVEDTYILPDGSICYLKGDSWVPMDQAAFVTAEQAKYIAEKVLEKSNRKKSEEAFPEIDLKLSSGPEIYDLEKRIREINGQVEIPFEKIERLVYEYSVEQAQKILDYMYPNGYKQVIYSDESMRGWEKAKWEKEGI